MRVHISFNWECRIRNVLWDMSISPITHHTFVSVVPSKYLSVSHILSYCIFSQLGFPSGSNGKEPSCNVRDPCSIPGSGRSSGEGNGYHSSILAWRIPWTKEPSGLQCMGSQRVGHDWMTNTFTFHDRPTTYITFISEKLKAFPLRLGTKQKS